jgi:two-component system response regulator PilR (NtrC family)
MKQAKALIIDDEPDILKLLSMTLQRMNVICTTAKTVAEATELLNNNQYDLCLSDMKLPDGDGMEIVNHIQDVSSGTPVAIITAHGNMELGIEAMKLGAFDFVSKPVELSRLRAMVSSALRQKEHSKISPKKSNYRLDGTSQKMDLLRSTIEKLARSQAPVYIAGESGSGKELVARLIHDQGGRYAGPFVPVNCGAIPSELMESEFFGHKKGSFTGAVVDKIGLFAAADGGTLFLDEVADLPLEMQVKLLRAIQERSVRPVGSEKEIPVNIRILSATHHDLAQQVRDGYFRQDLFYRINVIELKVPPLRERPEDIPELVESLLNRICNNESIPIINDKTMTYLQQYHFPGNVRELENILERAITLSDGAEICIMDLQLQDHTAKTLHGNNENIEFESFTRGNKSLEDFLNDIERKAISEALEACRWNKTAAAKELGITFRAMRYKLKKLGLE